ncbi:MAG: transposase, partial [Deltaproteobacteria bacterium]|nr:transposase [Kofleriaceae bacterium]
GLVNEIRHSLGHDPLGGHVFVFLNRRKNQVKLIVWTRGGFTIVHKRLLCGAPHKSRYAEPVVMRRGRQLVAAIGTLRRSRLRIIARDGGGMSPPRRLVEQGRDQCIGRLELPTAQRRWHGCFKRFQLLGRVDAKVDLGRAHVGVSQPERDLANVASRLQQVERATVPELVR